MMFGIMLPDHISIIFVPTNSIYMSVSWTYLIKSPNEFALKVGIE